MSYNLINVVDWQRDNASKLVSLIQQKEDWYNENVSDFFSDWERDVFNIETANEFGLFVWSIILNIPLYGVATVATDNTERTFYGDSRQNFNHGNYGLNGAQTYSLTAENRRNIIKIRAVELFTFHSTSDINARLKKLLGKDVFYYTETSPMKLTASFSSENDYLSLANFLFDYDLFPVPCGVGIEDVIFRG